MRNPEHHKFAKERERNNRIDHNRRTKKIRKFQTNQSIQQNQSKISRSSPSIQRVIFSLINLRNERQKKNMTGSAQKRAQTMKHAPKFKTSFETQFEMELFSSAKSSRRKSMFGHLNDSTNCGGASLGKRIPGGPVSRQNTELVNFAFLTFFRILSKRG